MGKEENDEIADSLTNTTKDGSVPARGAAVNRNLKKKVQVTVERLT